MTHSNLCSSINLTGNYNDRRGHAVSKITVHHMAGIMSGSECTKYFQSTTRQASANYCIGNDGDISCGVAEEYRAWTSSSRTNDEQAITIEVSNCEIGGDWKVSGKAWNSLVNLCVDICKRYGFKLAYTGTPDGSLTIHSMFAATACPGPYLKSRLGDLCNAVNARLETTQQATTSTTTTTNKYKIGDVVTFSTCYRSSTDSNEKAIQASNMIRNHGAITRIAEGAKNPYLLDNGLCWVNDGDIRGYYTKTATTVRTKTVDELAREVIAGKWGNGADRKNRLTNAGYDYNAVQMRVNQLLR